MTFQYDRAADVLYAFLGEPRPGIFKEPEDGIYIRLDVDTGEPIGFTIINYSRQKRDGHIRRIPHFPNVEIPY